MKKNLLSNNLINIINVLQKINNISEKKNIVNAQFKSETENIFDCKKKELEYEKIIYELSQITKKDLDQKVFVNGESVKKTIKLLIDLHLCLSDFVWHIEQVNDLVLEIIKQN